MTTATFQPTNKSFYTGNHGRLLLSKAGRPCVVLGDVTLPAEATKDRKPWTWTQVRFLDNANVFQVRPKDLVIQETP